MSKIDVYLFVFFVTTFVRKPADLSHVLPSRFHSDCHSSQEVRQLSLLSDTTYCHGNESDVGHTSRDSYLERRPVWFRMEWTKSG